MRRRRAEHELAGAALVGVAPVLLALLPCLLSAARPQQDEGRAEREEVDPYTEGDGGVLGELEYTSLGPFLFGDGRTTEVVADETGGVPLLWVQTRHFQLGCSLEPVAMPADPAAKKRLQAELKELRKRLPNVPRRVKELDPWLVLHVYAARLEALYSAFVERLGLQELAESDPYLGSGGPICVLLTEKKSTLARYTAKACNFRAENMLRYFFDEPSDQLFFGLSFEALEGDYRSDGGMHFAVVHGVTQVLSTAVRGYYGEPPTWFSLGLAHWFARDLVDEEILLFTTPPDEAGRLKDDANFPVKVRGRVKHGAFPSMEKMEGWTDPAVLRFPDHMVAWSKVDFLLRDGDGERAHELLWRFSEPLQWGIPERDQKQAEAWHAALVDVAGGELESLDEQWSEWVLEEYPKR